MKKFYTSPKAEMIEFDEKDVITTSGYVASTDENDYKILEGGDWTPDFY